MLVVVIILVMICLVLLWVIMQQRAKVVKLYKSDKVKSHFIKAIIYETRDPLNSLVRLAEMLISTSLLRPILTMPLNHGPLLAREQV